MRRPVQPAARAHPRGSIKMEAAVAAKRAQISKFGALNAAEKSKLQALLSNAKLELTAVNDLKPNPKNAKRHPEQQIALLAENIRKFGQIHPVICDETYTILAGHGRLLAIQHLGLRQVLVRRIEHLTDTQKRAFAIADNKLAELGAWDNDILAAELAEITDPSLELDFDTAIIGFETVEIDKILETSTAPQKDDPADTIPLPRADTPTTRPGDIWLCGPHRLICGTALDSSTYRALLGAERADLVFTDPPYNVPNVGHVTKRDGVREFAMAHGEMNSDEFIEFLRRAFSHIADHIRDGAVIFTCIDWRHYEELTAAARRIFGRPKNLIVWAKTNGGMGSFYRSQHEFIPVFVAPGASPTNNFKLGERGRYRTNVWKYPGVNTLGSQRNATLAMHPTVKPVALVVDAIKDCSRRSDLVLDPFAGSGTAMIAAERTGRIARLCEIDPVYCDVIVERWQTLTGKTAQRLPCDAATGIPNKPISADLVSFDEQYNDN